MDVSFDIGFSRSAIGGDLVMEQKEWADGTGIVKKKDIAALMRHYSSMMVSTPGTIIIPPPVIWCGLEDDGTYESIVYVYPQTDGLMFGITNGSALGGMVETVRKKEQKQLSLNTESSTEYPIENLISFKWIGDTYNSEGNTLTKPEYTLVGSVFEFDTSVYGTFEVEYETTRNIYSIAVPPRDSVENIYDSLFYVHWEGGVKMLTLTPPPNAERTYLTSLENDGVISCGFIDFSLFPPCDSPAPPDDVEGEDLTDSVDYCTQLPRVLYRS